MRTLSTYEIWYGVDRPPEETRELHAGPVTVLLDGIDLRYVRLGSLETVRRISVAVRDQNWNTIPGQHRITRVEQQADSFLVEFAVEHKAHDIDFAWQGRITGSPDGRIRYEMDGEAKSHFRYNRIGLCILHPFKECAGRPYVARTPQGEVRGTLPREIGPQRFEQGVYVPLFPSFSHLAVDLEGGAQANMTFEGDLFEMEDQRNWTDASFKTYSTPLALGFPHEAPVGKRIAQSFSIEITGIPASQAGGTQVPCLTLGQSTFRHLPALGFSLNSDDMALTELEIERLRLLRPDHLRVDLHLNRDYAPRLDAAIAACQALDCALEVALFISEEMTDALADLASQLRKRVRVARFLVLREGSKTATATETTDPGLVALARRYLQACAPQALFAGGTDMYFCELNRTRPQAGAMDAVSYTIIPQVHAFDERSLVETLEAQAETVRSAQAFANGRPVIVSPITLKRRYNPNATTAEAEKAPDELPDAVDPRQLSLLGAGWTAGSIKYLAESGASSLTYYEATGWRGLMERAAGSPLPERFPSVPGMVFPLYHVFADIAEWKDGTLIACTSNLPLNVTGLAIERGGSLHLLVVNLTASEQRVEVGPLAVSQVALRTLDSASAQQAMQEAEQFRQRRQYQELEGDTLVLILAPYATARVDAK
jgi:hypothetical protein